MDEIEARFVLAIEQQINSLPFRDPLKETVTKCGVEEFSPPVLVDWDIYSISFSEEITFAHLYRLVFCHHSALVSTPGR